MMRNLHFVLVSQWLFVILLFRQLARCGQSLDAILQAAIGFCGAATRLFS
jgi:hypothetical protein